MDNQTKPIDTGAPQTLQESYKRCKAAVERGDWIETLQAIRRLKNQVDALANTVVAQELRIDEMEAELADLKTRMDNARDYLQKLQAK